jgi:hypothetical protein
VEWQGWAAAATAARTREASRRKRGGKRDTAYAHYYSRYGIWIPISMECGDAILQLDPRAHRSENVDSSLIMFARASRLLLSGRS